MVVYHPLFVGNNTITMTGIFITATGTDIGKTYLTTSLLRWDQTQAKCLQASKPIISGWPEDENAIHLTDTGKLLLAQNISCSNDNIELCSPWRYREPLTPSMAAKKSGQPSLSPALLQTHCHQLIRRAKDNHCIHLIEGVGGVMAPLSGCFTVLDWLAELGCPALLIGGSYLGTLSHFLTAWVALQSKKIPVLAVVVNETPHSSVSLVDTTHLLKELLPVPVLPIGFEPKPTVFAAGLDKLYELIVSNHLVAQL